MVSSQIPLQIPIEDRRNREDLVVTSANDQAVKYIEDWPNWPGPLAILCGPEGAGKTHLAKIWQDRAQAEEWLPTDMTATGSGSIVLVEDIQAGGFSETGLFHLINSVRANSGSLLITSRTVPGDWEVALPDLASRLKTAHIVTLNAPDDHLLSGVLFKLFADRQLDVQQDVIEYLVVRMERSLAVAQRLVGALDHRALAERRGITRPLVREVLREFDAGR